MRIWSPHFEFSMKDGLFKVSCSQLFCVDWHHRWWPSVIFKVILAIVTFTNYRNYNISARTHLPTRTKPYVGYHFHSHNCAEWRVFNHVRWKSDSILKMVQYRDNVYSRWLIGSRISSINSRNCQWLWLPFHGHLNVIRFSICKNYSLYGKLSTKQKLIQSHCDLEYLFKVIQRHSR